MHQFSLENTIALALVLLITRARYSECYAELVISEPFALLTLFSTGYNGLKLPKSLYSFLPFYKASMDPHY